MATSSPMASTNMQPPAWVYQSPCFFSQTFKCYTSPLFYRNLVSELEWISSFFDLASTNARELVWHQLFIIVGVKSFPCSRLFVPIIKTWIETPTISLFAIELLYIAFALAFDKNPDILRTNIQNVTLHPELPVGTKLQTSQMIASSIVPNFQQTSAKPLGGDGIMKLNTINSRNTPNLQNNNSSPQHNKSSDAEVFQKLIDLQAWKTELDSLPEQVVAKIKVIWTTYDENIPLELSSFERLIDSWAKNILLNVDAIKRMHDVITFLKSSNSISLQVPSICHSSPHIPNPFLATMSKYSTDTVNNNSINQPFPHNIVNFSNLRTNLTNELKSTPNKPMESPLKVSSVKPHKNIQYNFVEGNGNQVPSSSTTNNSHVAPPNKNHTDASNSNDENKSLTNDGNKKDDNLGAKRKPEIKIEGNDKKRQKVINIE